MYEVRWTYIDGTEDYEEYEDERNAWKAFDDIKESRGIENVGLYYVDGDGAEKELEVWSR
jgi:hypothetical protein